MENSSPMEGRAMLMDEPMKGVKKEPMVAMRRVDFLSSMVILKREGGMVFKLLGKGGVVKSYGAPHVASQNRGSHCYK